MFIILLKYFFWSKEKVSGMATGYEQFDEKKANPFPVPGGYILTTIVSSTF